MEVPLQISYRDVPVSEGLNVLIRDEVAKLAKLYDRIVACRVVVEHAYERQQNGAPFHIRIILDVPGQELTITEEPNILQTLRGTEETKIRKSAEIDPAHKDARLAVRDAFRKAKRRLHDYARRRQGDVKQHAPPAKVRAAEQEEAEV